MKIWATSNISESVIKFACVISNLVGCFDRCHKNRPPRKLNSVAQVKLLNSERIINFAFVISSLVGVF